MGGAVRMQDLPDAGDRRTSIDKILTNAAGEKIITKKLCDVLPSGSWKGRRCFIIGGGTSLKGFDFSKLQGELIIAVNRAMEFVPFATIMIAQDARLWGWYESGDLGLEAKEKFNNFKGYKAWVNCQSFPYPEDLYIIDTKHSSDFNWKTYDYAGGIPLCTNTGLDALCLAVCLGASDIYLLGFDCYGKEGKTANFHAGYPDNNDDVIYKDIFLPNFRDLAVHINKKANVINLNPKSTLNCFKFGEFKDIVFTSPENKLGQKEKDTYEKLWSGPNYPPSQCALPLVEYVTKTANKKEKLLDIGCGDGTTVRALRLKGYKCKGLDITQAGVQSAADDNVVNKPVSKWFIESPIWKTGLEDNSVDYTFSTDVLEHLPPEMVDQAIQEIIRITKTKTFHCIALFSDVRDGEELHKTQKPIEWWQAKFDSFNKKGIQIELIDRVIFLMGR